MSYATIEDVTSLFRNLTLAEQNKANALIPIVEDTLRVEAEKVGRDLDAMIEEDENLANVAKSVVVDIVARSLRENTSDEPMTQMSQSALGYSVSGTYLVPGGGIFIKRSELAKLGLKRQRYGTVNPYADYGHHH